jgi:hypothetical protein
MKTARLLVSSLVLFAAPIACDHEHHAATAADDDVHHAPADVHHATTGRTTGAVREIVAARCEREERCDNVGPDKTYSNHAACTSKLEGSTADDINMKDCENGVSDAKLHECLAKIHGEDCGNPIDTLSRLTACRTGALCI